VTGKLKRPMLVATSPLLSNSTCLNLVLLSVKIAALFHLNHADLERQTSHRYNVAQPALILALTDNKADTNLPKG